MTENQNDKPFSLVVKFKDVGRNPHSIPSATLEHLAVSVADCIIGFFDKSESKKQEDAQRIAKSKVRPGEPIPTIEKGDPFLAAKQAFDDHRAHPSPGDAVQQVTQDIEKLMQDNLARDYGPTAVRNLHPVITFE